MEKSTDNDSLVSVRTKSFPVRRLTAPLSLELATSGGGGGGDPAGGKNRKRARRVVSLLPVDGLNQFCLVEKSEKDETNDQDLPAPSCPRRSWPIRPEPRSRSHDRVFTKKNFVSFEPKKTSFSRSSQSSTPEAASQEVAPPDGVSRRRLAPPAPPRGRSRSIVDKARVYEAEKPQPSYSTLPWSSKLSKSASGTTRLKLPSMRRRRLIKSCSSPSILEMIQKEKEKTPLRNKDKVHSAEDTLEAPSRHRYDSTNSLLPLVQEEEPAGNSESRTPSPGLDDPSALHEALPGHCPPAKINGGGKVLEVESAHNVNNLEIAVEEIQTESVNNIALPQLLASFSSDVIMTTGEAGGGGGARDGPDNDLTPAKDFLSGQRNVGKVTDEGGGISSSSPSAKSACFWVSGKKWGVRDDSREESLSQTHDEKKEGGDNTVKEMLDLPEHNKVEVRGPDNVEETVISCDIDPSNDVSDSVMSHDDHEVILQATVPAVSCDHDQKISSLDCQTIAKSQDSVLVSSLPFSQCSGFDTAVSDRPWDGHQRQIPTDQEVFTMNPEAKSLNEVSDESLADEQAAMSLDETQEALQRNGTFHEEQIYIVEAECEIEPGEAHLRTLDDDGDDESVKNYEKAESRKKGVSNISFPLAEELNEEQEISLEENLARGQQEEKAATGRSGQDDGNRESVVREDQLLLRPEHAEGGEGGGRQDPRQEEEKGATTFALPSFPENQQLQRVKCDIRIEITACSSDDDDDDDDDDEVEAEEVAELGSSGDDYDFAIIEDVPSDDGGGTVVDSDDPDAVEEAEDATTKVGTEDLEFLTVSDDEASDDEFEALRLQRLRTQRSVLAPERDVSEEDAETAEFQTRLRRIGGVRPEDRTLPLELLSTGLDEEDSFGIAEDEVHTQVRVDGTPSFELFSSAVADEDNLDIGDDEVLTQLRTDGTLPLELFSSAVADEDNLDIADDEVLNQLRADRTFDRSSQVPEREIEEEDRDSAELQTNLRKSKGSSGNDVIVFRKRSKPARRSSHIEVLCDLQEEGSHEEIEEASENCIQQKHLGGTKKKRKKKQKKLFRSLSGSDLDRLKKELVELDLKEKRQEAVVKTSPSLKRVLITNLDDSCHEVSRNCNDSPITADIKALAASLENLKERLAAAPVLTMAITRTGNEDSSSSKNNAKGRRRPFRMRRSSSWHYEDAEEEKKRQLRRQEEFWRSGRYQKSDGDDDPLEDVLQPPSTSPPPKPKMSTSSSSSLPNSPYVKKNRGRRSVSSSPRNKKKLQLCEKAGKGKDSGGHPPLPDFSEKESALVAVTAAENSADKGEEGESEEESEEEGLLSYQCLVTCSVRPKVSKLKNREVQVKMEAAVANEGLGQMTSDLSPDQISQLLSAVSKVGSNGSASTSNESAQQEVISPDNLSEDELKFLDYVSHGGLSNEEQHEGDKCEDVSKRNKNAAACQYFYRQRYLSIIEEEEEDGHTPASSRPESSVMSSSPAAIRKSNALKKAFREFKEKNGDIFTPESNAETISPKKSRDSGCSETSVESMTSVNSILSNEVSVSTSMASACSGTDTMATDPGKGSFGHRESRTLSQILDSVPPPPIISSCSSGRSSPDPEDGVVDQGTDIDNGPPAAALAPSPLSSPSHSTATLADSRCTSVNSVRELPRDDNEVNEVPSTRLKLTTSLSPKVISYQTEPKSNQSKAVDPKLQNEDLQSVSNVIKNTSKSSHAQSSSSKIHNSGMFHLSRVKDKFKSVLGGTRHNSAPEPRGKLKRSQSLKEANVGLTRKMHRFFRSSSRRDDSDDIDSVAEKSIPRRSSLASLTERIVDKITDSGRAARATKDSVAQLPTGEVNAASFKVDKDKHLANSSDLIKLTDTAVAADFAADNKANSVIEHQCCVKSTPKAITTPAITTYPNNLCASSLDPSNVCILFSSPNDVIGFSGSAQSHARRILAQASNEKTSQDANSKVSSVRGLNDNNTFPRNRQKKKPARKINSSSYHSARNEIHHYDSVCDEEAKPRSDDCAGKERVNPDVRSLIVECEEYFKVQEKKEAESSARATDGQEAGALSKPNCEEMEKVYDNVAKSVMPTTVEDEGHIYEQVAASSDPKKSLSMSAGIETIAIQGAKAPRIPTSTFSRRKEECKTLSQCDNLIPYVTPKDNKKKDATVKSSPDEGSKLHSSYQNNSTKQGPKGPEGQESDKSNDNNAEEKPSYKPLIMPKPNLPPKVPTDAIRTRLLARSRAEKMLEDDQKLPKIPLILTGFRDSFYENSPCDESLEETHPQKMESVEQEEDDSAYESTAKSRQVGATGRLIREESLTGDQVTLSEYESAMSDFEDTVSDFVVRRSRSNTPNNFTTPMISHRSNISPVKSFGQEAKRSKKFNATAKDVHQDQISWDYRDREIAVMQTSTLPNSSRAKKGCDENITSIEQEVGIIAKVADNLKEYLSDSSEVAIDLCRKISPRKKKDSRKYYTLAASTAKKRPQSSNEKMDAPGDFKGGILDKFLDEKHRSHRSEDISSQSWPRQDSTLHIMDETFGREQQPPKRTDSLKRVKELYSDRFSNFNKKDGFAVSDAEQILSKTDVGLASRMRRSPSLISEYSTLEPIMEEVSNRGDVIGNGNPNVYSATVSQQRRFYSLPRQRRSSSVPSSFSNWNRLTATLRVGGKTLNKSNPAQFGPKEVGQCDQMDFGSLKRKKAARTASLCDLMSTPPPSRSPTPSFTFQDCQSKKLSSSSVDLSSMYSALALNGKRWTSETSLTNVRQHSDIVPIPNVVIVKKCPCGNQVNFDPAKELLIDGPDTVVEDRRGHIKLDYEDSDYGSFDRRQEQDLFRALPVRITSDPEYSPNMPPPRPPPPVSYSFSGCGSLPRFYNGTSLSSSLPRSLSTQEMPSTVFDKGHLGDLDNVRLPFGKDQNHEASSAFWAQPATLT